jgi:hypothetical protein
MTFLERTLGKVFAGRKGRRGNRKLPPRKQSRRLTVEHMEPRMMMSLPPGAPIPAPPYARPPSAPTLTATAVSESQIDLAWNSVLGASGYVVDEKINGAWKQIASVGSGVTSHPVPGLSAGTTYSFEVGALGYFTNEGPSWSSSISAETIFPMTNGTYLRDVSTGAIDLIENGQGEWLSLAAYAYLGSPGFTNISDAAFQTIPPGPNYTIPDGTYLRDASTGAIDLIENGLGEWLSPAAYAYLGSPAGFTNISDAAFQTIPAGPNYVIPNGTYLGDTSTGAVDIIENGKGERLSPGVDAFLGSPGYFSIPHAAFASLTSGPNYIPSTTSDNWSGWAIDPSSQVNEVDGTWKLPPVTGTG